MSNVKLRNKYRSVTRSCYDKRDDNCQQIATEAIFNIKLIQIYVWMVRIIKISAHLFRPFYIAGNPVFCNVQYNQNNTNQKSLITTLIWDLPRLDSMM